MNKAIKLNKQIRAFSFDRDAKALYLSFSDKDVAYTKRHDDCCFIDFDRSNGIVGIEIIRVNNLRLQVKPIIKNLSREFHIPSLRRFHPEKLEEVIA